MVSKQSNAINSAHINERVKVLKVLAHPIRYSIVALLTKEGTLNVGEIQEALSIEQSTVSQHISKLREAQVVSGSREGTRIFYSVANPMVKDLINKID